ncbi:extracellular polysaccharide biosynthesis protein [Salmonella enterica subsp. salamae]|uniref:Extracellular polysaccharide biosynthesis protein n=1 Tax=Salmonella enterica subsp. salamae TaxID=59202 RepID=A0A6D2G9D6_SALER|nr:extracellular polysaccharide biosynthesis protein [Salmonella enterica subsp. salamae]
MTNLKKRERAKTNASLISMVQRFSDITIMFGGLWFICEVSGLPFLYMHLLVALITLVVFQMLGGMTDFYRSWRGVKISTELTLLLQNWTLSLIFSAGLVAFNDDFDNRLATWLAWYALSSLGLVLCRSFIRFGTGWLRNRGYNTRRSPSPEICLRARRYWIASVMSRGWVLRWWASITIPNRAASLLIGPGTSSS